jgi:hypothetical protein
MVKNPESFIPYGHTDKGSYDAFSTSLAFEKGEEYIFVFFFESTQSEE